MLRMSKLTDYGTMVLAQLAASDAGLDDGRPGGRRDASRPTDRSASC